MGLAISRLALLFAIAVSMPAISAPTHLVNEPPVSISEVEPGIFLVDFGRVAFGNLAMTGADNAGSRVTVHFAEALKDGRVDRNPPGTVRYKDTRETLAPGKHKVIAPGRDKRNTHSGNPNTPPAIRTPEEWDVLVPFRWVEIERFPTALEAKHISRRAAYLRDWDDSSSEFQSSNDLLNRVWELSRYSIKATSFAGIYIDGDRERIPYEGDAYLNQLSHYYTDYDKQMARDTFDHLMRHPTWPTEWASHMVFMAHADWMHTGDSNWLQERYETLKKKLLLERARADGLITSSEKKMEKGDLVDWPPGERDNYVFTAVNTVVNAFHLRSIEMMIDLATAIGNDSDASYYRDIYSHTLNQFQTQLFSSEQGLYRDGIDTSHHSLHANLFPLAFGLVPEANKQQLATWLGEKGIQCSVYAAQYLLEGLFENGQATQALDLITAEGDRSWRHMLHSGATVTWEAWDVKYKPNLDWNHAWGAAPANLLPRYILGAEPLEPGWQTARIRPAPGNLAFARGKVPTPKGPIHIDWKLEGGFRLELKLPPGVEAMLELPATLGSSGVKINGQSVPARKTGDRWLPENTVSGITTVEIR
jgi:alpha-L-rhamnosidase